MKIPTFSQRQLLWFAWIFFALVAGIHIWVVSIGFTFPVGGMREANNMVIIQALQDGGPILRYESPLWGPPWAAPSEFPIYHLFSKWLSSLIETGMAARLVSIFMLYLAIAAAWGILGLLGFSIFSILSFCAITLLSPIHIFYSHAPMMETTALFFGTAFLYFYLSAFVRSPFKGWRIAAASVMATLAALAKVTTAAPFFIATGVLWFAHPKMRKQIKKYAWVAVIPWAVAIPIEAAWAHWTDYLKSLNPLAEYLTSKNSHTWVWGTWGQVFSVSFWKDFLFRTRTHDIIGARFVLVASSITAILLGKRAFGFFLLLIALYLTAPFLFTNLHVVHRYYAVAHGFFLIAAIAWVIHACMEKGRVWKLIGIALLLVTCGLELREYRNDWYTIQIRQDQMPFEVARRVNAITRPNEVVIIRGCSNDGTIAYHAHRRAIMDYVAFADHEERIGKSIGMLAPETPLSAAVICGEEPQRAEYLKNLKRWAEVGPVLSTVTLDRPVSFPPPACEIRQARSKTKT